jgi:hypothetical protein
MPRKLLAGWAWPNSPSIAFGSPRHTASSGRCKKTVLKFHYRAKGSSQPSVTAIILDYTHWSRTISMYVGSVEARLLPVHFLFGVPANSVVDVTQRVGKRDEDIENESFRWRAIYLVEVELIMPPKQSHPKARKMFGCGLKALSNSVASLGSG